MHPLQTIVQQQKQGIPAGVYSCCSASEYVLRAAILRAKRHDVPVLIEATANQVNQFGGYTGMRPADFYAYVMGLAREYGLPENRVILGGDHLGPLTWTDLPEAEAMAYASELVSLFVEAGFTKIHLDTSMRLASDSRDERLSDAAIAARGARLCKAAEDAYVRRSAADPGSPAPVYVIGSEVPIPGGAQEAEDAAAVTRPADCMAAYEAFRAAFMEQGLADAWERVVGLVVQPGVEFGDKDVFLYDRSKAAGLIACLKELPLVFEGHSTDYQTPACLRDMVQDGIAILKVGPALTFALREALFALECMEKELFGGTGGHLSAFRSVLEHAMLESPVNWTKHYHGDGNATRFARAYSLSDRARYYLPHPAVESAAARLLKNLSAAEVPFPLISQYMPMQYPRVRSGALRNDPTALLLDRIGDCIDEYYYATLLPGWPSPHRF
ncbi:MAG TPA: class II D-tagatose-bisphosphate aldolase, non-catalytic subunit [Feifaniaceae bacterium]|nr:class II D-tagatose-bisphosphate aldolase, non-catalytic subunit [Feifaniaceae bacterium]